MDPSAYQGMNVVENRHWWFTARRKIIDRLIADMDLPEGARILEAGCGTGGNLALLARHGTLEAFEYDAEARRLASAKGVCPIKEGMLPNRVNASDASFDLVAMLDVLEHVDADTASLVTLRTKLIPGGRLLVTVPAMPFLWSRHDELHHHKRRYTKASLSAALVAAGFAIDRIGYFNSLLFPLAVMQRLVAKATGREEPLDAVPAAPLNRTFEAVFASERHFLGSVAFPVGLSLFAVARRRAAADRAVA